MNKLDLSKIPYIERDISWLEFNYRVLQEARDPTNPLMERLKFIAIFSSNRDEFYRVRVAHHRNIIRLGKKEQKALDFDSNQIMKDILRAVHRMDPIGGMPILVQQDELVRMSPEAKTFLARTCDSTCGLARPSTR